MPNHPVRRRGPTVPRAPRIFSRWQRRNAQSLRRHSSRRRRNRPADAEPGVAWLL